jgi:hypothetical protein
LGKEESLARIKKAISFIQNNIYSNPDVPVAAVEPTIAPPVPKAQPSEPQSNPKIPVETSPKSKEEEVLFLLNNKLESLGIEKLDNTKQLLRLNSIKGGYNTAITNKAQAIDDENEKEKMLNNKLKGAPSEETKEVWAKLVSKAKSPPAAKEKRPNITEGLINPFQLINFI